MNHSRRSILKKAVFAVAAFPILNNMVDSRAFAQTPAKAVDEKGPVSQALGYYADATKVDTVKWSKKAGPEGAKQLCSNCQLLLNRGKTVDSAPGEYGQCALFQDGLVALDGWCNSWVLKQGA